MRVVAWSLALFIACGGDDDAVDAAPDVVTDAPANDTPDATCELPAFETGDEGHADPLGSAAGEARAGRLAAVPDDRSRLLTWRAGDFVLANDRIALVIEDVGASDGFDPYGGKPVGMARVEDGALVEPADFNELVGALGRFTFDASSVTALQRGDTAVVRAIGLLRPIPFIEELAATLVPADLDHEIAVDYALEPDSNVVRVTYYVPHREAFPQRTNSLFMLVQSQRMPMFGPDQGFFLPEGDIAWYGFAKEDVTGYAVRFLPEPTGAPLEVSGASIFVRSQTTLEACTVNELPWYELSIGGPGFDGIRQVMWDQDGVATRTLTGTVMDASGPAQGVRVHAESSDGAAYYSRARTDETGAYSMRVPEDADVRLRAYRRAEGVVGPVDEGTAITMPDVGTLVIRATEGGEPVPVRVQVRPVGDGAPEPPERFGEEPHPRRRTHLEFPVDGVVELNVPPGMHRVVVSRGYEYTAFDSDIDVASGARVDVPVDLERVVDTTDVICADFHLHTNRSPDAPDDAAFKLRSAAGEGLEVPCRSEHEWVMGWEDVVAEQGLESWVFGITSIEVTTFSLGHFGVLPLDEQADQPNLGRVVWEGRTTSEFVSDVRARPSDPLFVINHPRLEGLGYFDAVGYDPSTGDVTRPELWDDSIRVIEVFNDPPTFDTARESVEDWFSFLNQGVRMWAVGSSDSHGVGARDMVIGYPRTCLDLGTDSVETLRTMGPNVVRDGVRSGRFTVVGGVYVDAWARDDVRPGGTVGGAASTESVRVRVQAPPWVDVDVLEVWVDGALSESIEIAESMDVVRFDANVDVGGSWVVFHAKGDQAMDPIHQDRIPFGVSSPIFFEP